MQKVFLYDASTETQDAEYIISEEFLNTVCPHKSSPDPASHSEDNENSEDQGETEGFWYNFFHP